MVVCSTKCFSISLFSKLSANRSSINQARFQNTRIKCALFTKVCRKDECVSSQFYKNNKHLTKAKITCYGILSLWWQNFSGNRRCLVGSVLAY